MITGKITYVGEEFSGISQRSGQQWRKREYEVVEVVEPGSRTYPQSVRFSLMNQDIDTLNLQVGSVIQFDMFCDVRDFTNSKGEQKRFNDVTLGNISLNS